MNEYIKSGNLDLINVNFKEKTADALPNISIYRNIEAIWIIPEDGKLKDGTKVKKDDIVFLLISRDINGQPTYKYHILKDKLVIEHFLTNRINDTKLRELPTVNIECDNG